ncbi:MAG: hypothetical protein JWO08_2869 [Verrucomicrobiaceae bacterium]|nr:hypothetical protein [Verrucomicrobiaceae bacterium]
MRFPLLHSLCIITACAVVGCRKAPPPKPSKAKREESSVRQSLDRENTKNFANAIRGVMEWHNAQPLPQGQPAHAAVAQEFSKRLQAVPSKGLPPDILGAWQTLQQASQKLATLLTASAPPASADLQKVKEEGRKASETLNQWLASQGFGDLHF